MTGWTEDNVTMSCQTNLRPNQSIIWIRSYDQSGHHHSEVIAHDENILVDGEVSTFRVLLKRNPSSSGVNALLTVSPFYISGTDNHICALFHLTRYSELQNLILPFTLVSSLISSHQMRASSRKSDSASLKDFSQQISENPQEIKTPFHQCRF